MKSVDISIRGFCPMGCGEDTLYATAKGGYIICAGNGEDDCSDPRSVSKLLSSPETDHVAMVGEYDFTIAHPMRERIGLSLLKVGIDV